MSEILKQIQEFINTLGTIPLAMITNDLMFEQYEMFDMMFITQYVYIQYHENMFVQLCTIVPRCMAPLMLYCTNFVNPTF